MRLQSSILFLITFSSFLLFTYASQAARGEEDRPDTPCESDTHDEWTEFMSMLRLANIPVKTQAQMSPNSRNRGPELLQRSLEILFSEETGKIVRSFETMINSIIALGMAFHDVIESPSSDNVSSHDGQFSLLLRKVAMFISMARDDFLAKFPLPATAPGHAERERHIGEALESLQRLIVRLAGSHGIEQEVIQHHLDHVKPYLRDVGVLIGDMVELYPSAIEALVLHLSAVLLPEAIFLRSLVILYYFGPYVLGRDAIGGWLLQHL